MDLNLKKLEENLDKNRINYSINYYIYFFCVFCIYNRIYKKMIEEEIYINIEYNPIYQISNKGNVRKFTPNGFKNIKINFAARRFFQ